MGTLFVVGTPIGNLEDMTARGARVLGQVALVAAEDTRVTRRLLTHLGIRVQLISYRQHNWQVQLPRLLNSLETSDVALVCDAGMPVLSDPGSELVSAVANAGFRVEVVPGPSALTAALAVSGFSADEFLFLGFLPRRRKERRERLRTVAPLNFTLVLFEAPHRVQATLRDVLEELGDRKVSVCRELTKLYEEVFRGNVSQAIERVQAPRGEYVLVIQVPVGQKPPEDEYLSREDEARRQLAGLRERGIGAKDAVTQVAKAVDLPKNRIYRLWVETASGRRPSTGSG
jgi:16S rRNA (cytidine1402-2'-O)-methyltransferase